MLVKRALVVDDSKSARAFLIRLLAEQQVEVDAAETAEQAIEHLEKNTPDVIFMDHLMPGMDGFQAVQAIKANPRTAAIPIMMYTSQEGELYLGQARALGAVGVLPKSVSPADVRMVLQQLQLGDQPTPVTPTVHAPVVHALRADEPVDVPTVEMQVAEAGPSVAELVKVELDALRQHLAEALDAHREQVLRDMRTFVREAAPAKVEPVGMFAEPRQVLPETPRHSPVPWVLALAAGIAAAAFGTLWWQGSQQQQALSAELMDSKSTVELLTARLAPSPDAPAPTAPAAAPAQPAVPAADMVVLQVPFGEAPLSGARVKALRDFVARIAALGQKGTIDVHRSAGRFCLSGSSTAGFALAEGAMPAANCDLVAEATDPQVSKGAVESSAFSRALEDLRKEHAALLTIDVTAAQGEAPHTAYPDASAAAGATASEWNAVATDNNRVEIRWLPAT